MPDEILLQFGTMSQVQKEKFVCSLLADSQQAFLYSIPLRLGERKTFGEAVDGVQCGVDEGGVVLGPSEERGATGEEG